MPCALRLTASTLLALALAAPAQPAQAVAPPLTLLHAFDFSTDANSSSGAIGSLHGGATVADGMLQLRGAEAWAGYDALIPSAEDAGASWWSVSLWARQTTPHPGAMATMVGQGPAAGFLPEFTLGIASWSDPAQVQAQNQSGWAGAASAGQPGSGWHHYATTMRENAAFLYVDGVLVASGAAGHDYNTPYYHGSLRLGRQVAGFGEQFTGDLDDVRIYAGRLDDATVAAQFAGGPSPVPEPGAWALWALGLAGLSAVLRLSRRRLPRAQRLAPNGLGSQSSLAGPQDSFIHS